MEDKARAMTVLRTFIADRWDGYYTAALGAKCDLDWINSRGAVHACVFYDGSGKFKIFIDESMMKENLKVQAYEVMHELAHVLLGHLTTRFHSAIWADKERANIAQDLALNCLISVPESIVNHRITPKVWEVEEDKSSEYYYHILKDNPNIPKLKSVTIDELMEMIKNGFPVNFKMIDTIKGPPLEEHEMEKIREEIGRLAGSMPGELQRMLNKEGYINFQKFVNKITDIVEPDGNKGIKKTWAYQNRRNPSFRGKVRRMMSKIFLILDASGSISQQDLNVFAGALHRLAEYCRIFVCVTDAGIHEKFWFRGTLSKVTGGGGTIFHKAFELAEEMKFTNIVILTDGMCDYPHETTAKTVLWGIINNANFKPKFGTVVTLK